MNAVFAGIINRYCMQLAKIVIAAVLFACWVQLKEKGTDPFRDQLILYESLDLFFEARIFSIKF